MNAVKVVGGLLEIGAALKFVNTAELGFGTVPEDAWFNAPMVLSIWVVLAAISGLYLLGIFRTDHDHAEVEHVSDGQRRACQHLAHRDAFDELRHDERQAVVGTDVIDRHNIGVIQTLKERYLAVQSALIVRIPGSGIFGDGPQRNCSAHVVVRGVIRRTHRATARRD